MLDNREMAALIWLGIALLCALSYKKFRSSLGGVLGAFFNPLLCLPLLFMLAYIGLEVWLGLKLRLWHTGLVKGTVIWAVASAGVLYFNCMSVATDPHFFRRTVAATVGVAVFVEFFMNLFVMNLFAEFVLQPVMVTLALLPAVAGTRAEHQPAKRVLNGLLGLLGFALFAFALWQVLATWRQLDKHQVLLEFLLPIWLTIGLMPFIYLLSLYVTYDSAFRGINWATSKSRARWRARAALVRSFHAGSRELHAFNRDWVKRLTTAPSYTAARQVISEFRRKQEVASQAAADEEERLRRYAGSEATDAAGRRLDRREFKETIDALRWLGTCQMGWYRNHGGRYRADLLAIIGNDFTRRGLPKESGITMRVANDGQAWYGGRRTITGWCFAIGAASPPPDQWEFDGPNPPEGFPGEDRTWGDRPFSDEANRNWI